MVFIDPNADRRFCCLAGISQRQWKQLDRSKKKTNQHEKDSIGNDTSFFFFFFFAQQLSFFWLVRRVETDALASRLSSLS